MDAIEQRVSILRKAFRKDGFEVRLQDECMDQNRMGIILRYRSATNFDTGEVKRAYYVEGSPYQRGYLMGWMAEPEIARLDFLSPEHPKDDYKSNPVSRTEDKKSIGDCVLLFDLKHGTEESHFGDCEDKWVRLTLGNNID